MLHSTYQTDHFFGLADLGKTSEILQKNEQKANKRYSEQKTRKKQCIFIIYFFVKCISINLYLLIYTMYIPSKAARIMAGSRLIVAFFVWHFSNSFC